MMSANSTKSAIITGASGGIGRASVDLFMQQGWRVIAIDQRKPEKAFDASVYFLKADLSKAREIEALEAKLAPLVSNGLQALVNNAALQVIGPLAELEVRQWDMVMAVNLRAPFLLAKTLMEYLTKTKSAIVNVSSVHALASSAGIGAYASSKGGLLALTRSMAIEFAERGIRVNAVLPGATDTDMLTAGLERGSSAGKSSRKILEENILLGRIAKPMEIAQSIYFLANEEQSSYITGQALVVDGGATTRLSTE